MYTFLSRLAIEQLGFGDLHALCYELDVEYDSLKGKGREAKARELFVLMRRQDRLGELTEAIRRRQPEAFGMTGGKRLNWRVVAVGLAALLFVIVVGLVAFPMDWGDPGQGTIGPTTMAAGWQPKATAEPTIEPTIEIPSPTPVPAVPIPDKWTISYANAADWLDGLAFEDHDDQILDWAVWGLAGLLKLDTKTLRDAFYDQTMVRDPIFEGLTANRIGLGRGFLDNRGILHMLAPANDPAASRAIGMVLDDYRKDAGIDPERVLIYWYEIDRQAQQVILMPDGVRMTQAVRDEYGYREMRVDTLEDLQRFLEETCHLSHLELRDRQLWAGGWNWPDAPAGQVTAQDLAVLQNGYRRAARGMSSEPGFSLDPGEMLPLAELGPLLRRADLSAQEYQEYLDKMISNVGQPSYQVARYEGGLQGTEAGMTYFYTDLVAKAWSMGKGKGAPIGQVPGFVSDLRAKTPWGHCTTEEESGRLWFGLREEAISIHSGRIDLGSITTRVFTLIQDPMVGDREIEPSYRFGRIIWWWDRHYLAMADYEPQYHRLDQLMRWGAAIAWLVEQDIVMLPKVPNAEVKDNWHFGDWLALHPELKWRFNVPFVEPPGETTEALLILYSKPHEDCGGRWIWAGGISNPSIERIVTIEQARPDLGPEVARAGLRREGTTYSSATQAGTITNLDGTVKRTLNPVEGNVTQVDTVVEGRKVWSLGTIKVWVSEKAQRGFSLEFSSAARRISQRLGVQGVEMGELSVTTEATVATVRLRRGPLGHARRFFTLLQEALPGRSLLQAMAATKESSPIYTEADSERVFIRLDGIPDTYWFAVEEGLSAAGTRMAFRLRAPGKSEMYTGYSSEPPTLPTEWLKVTYPGQGQALTRFQGADPPGEGVQQLPVRYAHSERYGSLSVEKDLAIVRTTDQIFGLEGTTDGLDLMEPATLKRVSKTRQAIQASGDDYARATPLSTGSFVLVDSEELTIVPPDDPWHERVQAAIEGETGKKEPFFEIEHDQVSWGGTPEVQGVEPSVETVPLSEFLESLEEPLAPNARGPPTCFEKNLANVILEEGRLPPGAIGTGFEAQIVQPGDIDTDYEVRVAQVALSEPLLDYDFLDLDQSKWLRYWKPSRSEPVLSPSPTPTLEPGDASVILVYLEGACSIEQNLIRCGE